MRIRGILITASQIFGLAFWLVILALVLSGCGGGGPMGDSETGVAENDFKAIVIQYDGNDLHCVERGGSSHGHYSGLTCDWVRYHEEN